MEIVEKKVNEFSFIKSKVAQKISPQLMSFVKEYHGCYYSSQTGQSLFSGDSIGWQTLENSDKVRKCFSSGSVIPMFESSVFKQVTILKYLVLNSKFQDASQEVEINLNNLGEPSTDAALVIADSLYGCSKHKWDHPEHKWGSQDFKDVFEFAKNFGEVRVFFQDLLKTKN